MFSLEYADWFMLEQLQREAVMKYGYSSDQWWYILDLKEAMYPLIMK